jgi:hypothetical protein
MRKQSNHKLPTYQPGPYMKCCYCRSISQIAARCDVITECSKLKKSCGHDPFQQEAVSNVSGRNPTFSRHISLSWQQTTPVRYTVVCVPARCVWFTQLSSSLLWPVQLSRVAKRTNWGKPQCRTETSCQSRDC